jgi:hypothetical protein
LLNVSTKLNPDWMTSSDIRPYVFIRNENRIESPGSLHRVPAFDGLQIMERDPLRMSEVEFGDQIIRLDAQTFGQAGLTMPRWVFYDCAVMPGLIVGFAHKTRTLPQVIKDALQPPLDLEWTPLSLFITIPAVNEGVWMAHNLCSVNSLIPKKFRYRGLGFLSKALGLWYANIKKLCGVAQWHSPSLRLHSNFGAFEVLTSYTPIHDYAKSVTYRLWVDAAIWNFLFDKESYKEDFLKQFKNSGRVLDPKHSESLKQVQSSIENSEGPFFLFGEELLEKEIGDPLTLYTSVGSAPYRIKSAP